MRFIKIMGVIVLCFTVYSCNNKKAVGNEKIIKDPMLYFGQQPPTTTPKIFAPGTISKPDRYEFGCTLSKDGKEFYFGVASSELTEIYRTNLEDGKWTEPENIFQEEPDSFNDPMLSNDENRLYFISDRPRDANDDIEDIDIWYAERKGGGWSSPINVGSPVNNDMEQYYISFNNEGAMYFSSNINEKGSPEASFDIYKADPENGGFLDPQKLPSAINTNSYEADVYVAPDESYIIFCSIRENGLGRGDLYISFKDKSGNWTEAKSMGDKINTKGHELCPFVTRDGKYFFYTSNEDIYWVSSEIINALKE